MTTGDALLDLEERHQAASRLRKMWREERTPDPATLDTLPKPTSRDARKGKCGECGKWHGLPAVHLDYMGHAEVTEALLRHDLFWSWEPMAYTESGAPLVIQQGNDVALWIRLTVLGHTRIGVGTAPGAKGGDAYKELIGDAIRNAAMRFGVAVTLWSKAEGLDPGEIADGQEGSGETP